MCRITSVHVCMCCETGAEEKIINGMAQYYNNYNTSATAIIMHATKQRSKIRQGKSGAFSEVLFLMMLWEKLSHTWKLVQLSHTCHIASAALVRVSRYLVMRREREEPPGCYYI